MRQGTSRIALALSLFMGAVAGFGGAAAVECETFVFDCDDHSQVVVRVSEDEAWVFRPEGTLRLPLVSDDGETEYSGGSFVLRIEGQQARLGDAGGPVRSCRNDRRRAVWEQAKLDGAEFRAVGNEPGWVLEIYGGSRALLVTDYGESRVELVLPEPSVDREARRTLWEADDLTLEVIGRPCRDSMSGEEFESEVVLWWQGRNLRGCGRALH